MISTALCNATARKRLHAGAAALAIMFALATTLISSAGAATFYVDNQSPTCSAVGPGTESQPYCTITAAVAARKGADVTIVVKPGVYREQVTIPASGTEAAPYVIRAHGPGVLIDGADDFTNQALWVEPGPAHIPGDHDLQVLDYAWLAPGVTWPAEQVFVNGRRLLASKEVPGLLPAGAFTWVEGEGLYVRVDAVNPGRDEILVGRRASAFRIAAKSWVTIEGFEIDRVDDTGINLYLGCSDIVIARNRITRSNSYGIKSAGGLRILIEGNSVSEGNFHGIGLTAGASNCIVRDNASFLNAQPNARTAKGIHLQGAPDNVIVGNRTHDNQDTGIQVNSGSHNCLLYNNRSWNNGDHGYDHLDATGTTHIHNVAYGNYRDGFSIEGNSPNSQIYNCISVDNGLTTDGFNLWVNAASAVGFGSDYNIFWNSTEQEPVKFITTKYSLLNDYQVASGQDLHSLQANPMFVDSRGGYFMPLKGSPAIDAGNSGVPNWPANDMVGNSRYDDPATTDAGAGPVTFADIGALEYVQAAEDALVELPSPRLSTGSLLTPFHGTQAAGSARVLALSTGFPNPSRGPVEFALDLPNETLVEWTVYDLQGRTVWSEDRTFAAGRAQLRWDGIGSTGEPAATGIYLVRARVDGTQLTRRIIRF